MNESLDMCMMKPTESPRLNLVHDTGLAGKDHSMEEGREGLHVSA